MELSKATSEEALGATTIKIVLEPEKTLDIIKAEVREFTPNGSNITALIAYITSEENPIGEKTERMLLYEGQEYLDLEISGYNLATMQARVDAIVAGKVKV